MDFQIIIALGIILVVCAGIFYYCYSRLNVLEESVINQGKILQTFLISQQNNGGAVMHESNDINTESQPENFNNNDKIDISDDGESEEESDDESEEESDNESVDNESEDENNKIKLGNEEMDSSIGIVNLNEPITDSNAFVFSQILDVKNVMDNLNIENPSGTNNLKEIENITEIENLEDQSKIKVVDIENKTEENDDENDDNKKPNKSLTKMNNQELKDLILKKGLATNDDISKLKKSELIELLQNK